VSDQQRHVPADCAAFDDRVDELAFGVVDPAERAELLAHADGCHRCRSSLAEAQAIADDLLLMAPGADPPDGFTERTVAMMTASAFAGVTPLGRPDVDPAVPRPASRWPLIAAAAAAEPVAEMSTWSRWRAGRSSPSTGVRSGRPRCSRVIAS
jgi:hypothetical protein